MLRGAIRRPRPVANTESMGYVNYDRQLAVVAQERILEIYGNKHRTFLFTGTGFHR